VTVSGFLFFKGDEMKFTNKNNVHISTAVFLAYDDYDYDNRPNAISATGLLNSVRQTILSKRVITSDLEIDVSSFLASSFGTAVHDAIEKAWKQGYKKSLKRLGYTQNVIDNIKINPTKDELTDECHPVYIEQRVERELAGVTITGKYDFIIEGQLSDHKTTSTYGYIKGVNDIKHSQQGSIYRWLNPDIITNDIMIINYYFTDWSALRAKIEKNKGYPSHKYIQHNVQLMSLSETENFIRKKIENIKQHRNTDEADLPLCTTEELWQDDTVYKYYKDPKNRTRSTRNFDNFYDAQALNVKQGSTGIVVPVHGKVRRCKYCNGFSICSQGQKLFADGLIDLED
jgi:hypothetical protein